MSLGSVSISSATGTGIPSSEKDSQNHADSDHSSNDQQGRFQGESEASDNNTGQHLASNNSFGEHDAASYSTIVSEQKGANASLVLSDGTCLRGRAFGSMQSTSGEVVFCTGMVGYPESLTDPSFAAQIMVLTYPLIGNYGVPERKPESGLLNPFESSKIHAKALVVSTLSGDKTHWNAASSLHNWLDEEGVVGIEGIDTRALTKKLRHEGSISGKILVDQDAQAKELENSKFEDISTRNLVAEVSCKEPILHGQGSKRVVLVDCGVKLNIIRSLLSRGLSVLQVPWDHDFNSEDADGIFVTNGPGDPQRAESTIGNLRAALEYDRPIFGICLGNQLLGLAAGCNTYKLPFGHRSQNQPCQEVGTQRCHITSQNHGYAIDGKTLPDSWSEWFVNANDGSNEGIRHKSKAFQSVQFHPEAFPGPMDTAYLFDRFAEQL